MKSNYIVRAMKFMKTFIPYIKKYGNNEGMLYRAVNQYNMDYHRCAEFHYGVSRFCVCVSDYAIKWDREDCDGCFGGCENEIENYKFACSYGYEYLFAEITRIEVMGYTFYVMPRVKKLAIDVGDAYTPDSRLTCDEYDFLYYTMELEDMHDENWGLVNGKVVIIDYACRSKAWG